MSSNSPRRAALDEKRSFPRVSASCPVSWKPIGSDPAFQELRGQNEAILSNISGGGICFESAEKVEVGTMLALEVHLAGFPTAVISMGKVVWCRPSEERTGGHDVGVEFWWIGWKDQQAQDTIRQFIAQSLRSAED